jgi:putative transposase
VLQQLTRQFLESALEGEITDYLGYGKHDPAGHSTGNSRNGSRAKTVLTDVGPVDIKGAAGPGREFRAQDRRQAADTGVRGR